MKGVTLSEVEIFPLLLSRKTDSYDGVACFPRLSDAPVTKTMMLFLSVVYLLLLDKDR